MERYISTRKLVVHPPAFFSVTALRIRFYRKDDRGLVALTSQEAEPAALGEDSGKVPTKIFKASSPHLRLTINGQRYVVALSSDPDNITLSGCVAALEASEARGFATPLGGLGLETRTTGLSSRLSVQGPLDLAAALGLAVDKEVRGMDEDLVVREDATYVLTDPSSSSSARYFYRYLTPEGATSMLEAMEAPLVNGVRVLAKATIFTANGLPFPGILAHISHDKFWDAEGRVVPANSFTLRTDHEGRIGVLLYPNVRYRLTVPGLGLTYYFRSPDGVSEFSMLDASHADDESTMGVVKPVWGDVVKMDL